MVSIRTLAALGVVLASAAVFAAPEALKSRWLTGDMKVDGAPAEWPSLSTLAPKVTAAAANDDTMLRLVLATNDATICGRLRVTGLMVYVDPKNIKSQKFAIRVPPLGGKPLPGEPLKPHLTYVAVFGPVRDEMHLVDPPPKYGIEAASGVQDDTWYIELALPLRAGEGQPYAPGVAANTRVIGLGLVTPDPPKPPADSRSRGQAGGGSWGFGGYGGSYGGGPVPPGTSKSDDPLGKPVKVWTTIELARR